MLKNKSFLYRIAMFVFPVFVQCDEHLKYTNTITLDVGTHTWGTEQYCHPRKASKGIVLFFTLVPQFILQMLQFPIKLTDIVTHYYLLYLCHSARRLSIVDCFSVAFPINSCCCFLRLATSSSSWLPSPSLFMAEDRAISLVFSCSTAWQTSWVKQKYVCCGY